MEIQTSGSTSHLPGHNKAAIVTVCHCLDKMLSDAQYQWPLNIRNVRPKQNLNKH